MMDKMTIGNDNICLGDDLKKRAFAVLESYDLTPSQAIRLFLNQVANTKTVPLSLDYKTHYPNAKPKQPPEKLVKT